MTNSCKSSDVVCGDGSLSGRCDATGVRRCFVRYDADRGSTGLELGLWGVLNEGLRLPSGDVGVDVAGDLCDGGV